MHSHLTKPNGTYFSLEETNQQSNKVESRCTLGAMMDMVSLAVCCFSWADLDSNPMCVLVWNTMQRRGLLASLCQSDRFFFVNVDREGEQIPAQANRLNCVEYSNSIVERENVARLNPSVNLTCFVVNFDREGRFSHRLNCFGDWVGGRKKIRNPPTGQSCHCCSLDKNPSTGQKTLRCSMPGLLFVFHLPHLCCHLQSSIVVSLVVRAVSAFWVDFTCCHCHIAAPHIVSMSVWLVLLLWLLLMMLLLLLMLSLLMSLLSLLWSPQMQELTLSMLNLLFCWASSWVFVHWWMMFVPCVWSELLIRHVPVYHLFFLFCWLFWW